MLRKREVQVQYKSGPEGRCCLNPLTRSSLPHAKQEALGEVGWGSGES